MKTTPSKRPGRPKGALTTVTSGAPKVHHYSFSKAVLEGISIRDAWERYLAFEGGPDDERHARKRFLDVLEHIRRIAEAKSLFTSAESIQAYIESRLKADENLRNISRSVKARERLNLGGVNVSGSVQSAPAEAPELFPAPGSFAPSVAASDVPQAPPTLEDFIEFRCREGGFPDDMYSEREWIELYEDEYGASAPAEPTAMPALFEAPSSVDLIVDPAELSYEEIQAFGPTEVSAEVRKAAQEAIHRIERLSVHHPHLADAIDGWVSDAIANSLLSAAVDGKPIPLVTLSDLHSFINIHGFRWWRHVPRLGRVRAQRLVLWLNSFASVQGEPLSELALRPLSEIRISARQALACIDSGSEKRFDIVPLDRLWVPPQIDGRTGALRVQGPNTMGAQTDLEAIQSWLARHRDSPRTYEAYARCIERFYLWSLLEQRKELSSLVEADIRDFRDFIASPPPHWVQAKAIGRESEHWRPFKGPLSPRSQRYNLSVVSALMTALIQAGYLSANASAGVLPSMKLPHHRIDIDRSFTEAQWAFIMDCWREQYRAAGPAQGGEEDGPIPLPSPDNPDHQPFKAASLRRTRLVLELGATTGLRLIELATTRLSSIVEDVIDGQSVRLIKVIGKGNKEREVVLYDDVFALIEAHHRDIESAGTGFDRMQPHVRRLLSPRSIPADEKALASVRSTEEEAKPLIGALRKAPPKWKAGPNGEATLDRDGPSLSDRYGALDPTALYQSLKRFFRSCARAAEESGRSQDVRKIQSASTHWLRHFFANSAAADQVPPASLMAAMGHADLQTTSIYLKTERSTLVREMAKMRRR